MIHFPPTVYNRAKSFSCMVTVVFSEVVMRIKPDEASTVHMIHEEEDKTKNKI